MILPTFQSFLLLFTGIVGPSLSHEGDTHGSNLRNSDSAHHTIEYDDKCITYRDSLDGCIRFSKITEGRTSHHPKYPLSSNVYPFTKDTQGKVRQTDAESVVSWLVAPTYRVYNSKHLLFWAGGEPSFPTCNGQDFKFWNELREVIEVQKMRLAQGDLHGGACQVMPLPKLWKHFTMNEAAEAVRNEYPGLNQEHFLTEVLKMQYGEFTYDEDVIKGYSKSRFVRGDIMIAEMNTWAVGTVSDSNFYLKWRFGRPRPEEVLNRVYRDSVKNDDGFCDTNDLPSDVTDLAIFNVKVTDPDDFKETINEATKFTAYENEGSPKHPSWPAMHSAASSSALWLATVIDLESPGARAIIEEAMMTDYAVAYARTIAGVHYPSDSIAGLKLGQGILSDQLQYQLSGTWGRFRGGSRRVIRAKIAKIKELKLVDWDEFFKRHGIVNNVGIEEKDGYNSIAGGKKKWCTVNKSDVRNK